MAAMTWQCPICEESSDYEGTCPAHLTLYVLIPQPDPASGTTPVNEADHTAAGAVPAPTEEGATVPSPVGPASPRGPAVSGLIHAEPDAAPPSRRLALMTPWQQQIELPEHGELVIGRSNPALKDNSTAREMLQISRRHARFHRDSSGDLYVEDLGSMNGTFLDGLSVADRGSRIHPGQTLRLGQDVECTVIALNEFGEPNEEYR